MALDGLTLRAIKTELEEKLIGGRLDKIYQPEENLLTLRFRQPGENIKLLLSANPQNPRIYITESNHDNPLRPPTFCMLLRKHLEHGRLRKIEQPDFERILKIHIDSKNKQGEIETKTLLIETMGRHSNIILIDNENQILDSIKRVTSDMSRHREILPGHEYQKPPKQGKINPLTINKDEFMKRIKSDIDKKVYRAIMENIRGISPLIAKELAYRAGLDKNDKIRKINNISLEKLWSEFKNLIKQIKAEEFEPNLIINNDKFEAYSITKLTSLSQYQPKQFNTTNKLLDYYFTNKIKLKKITDLKNSLKGVTSDNIDKAMKKYRRVKGQLQGAKNADKYRIKGELIKANIYRIEPGQTKLEATNYYSDDEETMNIQLDADLSPIENAQEYFEKYDKAKNSVDYLKNELRKAKNEVNYLKQVEVLVEQAESIEDLQEIKEELISEGYIKKQKSQKDSRKQKHKKSQPLKFKSSDGFDIRVGRNNRQNDKLVKYESSNQDFWLHAKDIPGAHVIIKNHTRDEIPQTSIEEAAHLAAYYSKGKNSSNVPVDYTLSKHVNKPKGAKPGMVYYENQQTLYVTPQKEIIKKMNQQ
ncbi:Rqc2 family fibronectin-binding protein [Sporohalobacter salinus]|uniref:Rqc2 family fibronectin-binding protein n=1 Tax=Sporohalobacter salinus TaxID=1494606 RepID=UPI00195F6932|nr:NFACT RNA binding domain-containing protein [Sporohalobacter salinus]MBM7623353.1 putative ribosome quality control (RQC) complex YloA/Tae2 family protein [Sporohalobacter salinus]